MYSPNWSISVQVLWIASTLRHAGLMILHVLQQYWVVMVGDDPFLHFGLLHVCTMKMWASRVITDLSNILKDFKEFFDFIWEVTITEAYHFRGTVPSYQVEIQECAAIFQLFRENIFSPFCDSVITLITRHLVSPCLINIFPCLAIDIL